MNVSVASLLASDWDKAEAFIAKLGNEELLAAEYEWSFWARPEQLAPAGDWTTWLFLGGRGAGKTRAGAEWVIERANSGAGRIACVAATLADARDVMVEGESGILRVAPPWARPAFEPSKRRITFENGATASLFSAEEPDSLRGPQHDTAWCDELAKWPRLKSTWDNLQFGLRLGQTPRQMITTTPRPLRLLKEIMARSDTAVTRGSTQSNRPNLAPAFFAEIIRRYEGTRLGRQELDAEILEDIPGALWTRAMLDAALMPQNLPVPETVRVVVGVDPSGTTGNDARNQVGIVVAAKGKDGLGYVLADLTASLSPAAWGARVAQAAESWRADCIVAESNFGGAMVENVLRTAGVKTRVKVAHASQGKTVRAEPIAALYEQRRVRHAAAFPGLDDQLCAFTTEGYSGDGSPDRADALVWALKEVMLEQPTGLEGWIEYAEMKSAERRKKGLVW